MRRPLRGVRRWLLERRLAVAKEDRAVIAGAFVTARLNHDTEAADQFARDREQASAKVRRLERQLAALETGHD